MLAAVSRGAKEGTLVAQNSSGVGLDSPWHNGQYGGSMYSYTNQQHDNSESELKLHWAIKTHEPAPLRTRTPLAPVNQPTWLVVHKFRKPARVTLLAPLANLHILLVAAHEFCEPVKRMMRRECLNLLVPSFARSHTRQSVSRLQTYNQSARTWTLATEIPDLPNSRPPETDFTGWSQRV